jgi:hypothetical protein
MGNLTGFGFDGSKFNARIGLGVDENGRNLFAVLNTFLTRFGCHLIIQPG